MCVLSVVQARDMVMMAVRSHFRPEFINRIDEFIMFDPLEQEQIKSIVRLQVRGAGHQLQSVWLHWQGGETWRTLLLTCLLVHCGQSYWYES
jgi:ATP-dependent Clp protease ATP-binding subunit ClpA